MSDSLNLDQRVLSLETMIRSEFTEMNKLLLMIYNAQVARLAVELQEHSGQFGYDIEGTAANLRIKDAKELVAFAALKVPDLITVIPIV